MEGCGPGGFLSTGKGNRGAAFLTHQRLVVAKGIQGSVTPCHPAILSFPKPTQEMLKMVKFASPPIKLASKPEVPEESQPPWLSEPSSCIPSTTLDQHSPSTLKWWSHPHMLGSFHWTEKGMMSSHFLPFPTPALEKFQSGGSLGFWPSLL